MNRVELKFSNVNDINHIVHISDIHIRLLDRHSEYREVFNRVYDYISKTPDDTLIFLGGDIVHSKLDMSAELIDIISDFFTTLTTLRPVILIKGNHDLNVKNMKRMDVLKPIVKSLKLNNFYYIDDYTNIYNFNNKIDFVLYPFWTDEQPPIHLLGDNLKIGMYHGAINGSVTDVGKVLDSDIEVTKFRDVDILLLGDIHKYQVMSSNRPISAYPGSLIQQDFGENVDRHGLLLWDLNTKTHKHIDIYNDYGYYNVVLDNSDELISDDVINSIKSNRPNIKVRFEKKNKVYFDIVKQKLKKKFPNLQSVIPDRINNATDDIKYKENLINFNDVDIQLNLLMEYYTENKYDYSGVGELHKKFLNELDITKKVNNIWKPIFLKFSNLFSYGEDNEIDFRAMDGSYGIFAPNTSGKSSLMEVISFICFNKTSKTNQAIKILNVNTDNFNGEFIFEHNNILYKVHRTGVKETTKSGSKMKLKTNLYIVDSNFAVIEDITKGKNDLYKDLKTYLGDYDDFVLTALSLQNNNTNFIDKTQSERKELIQQFLEMDVFEKLFGLANTKSNEYKNILSNLNNKYKSISEFDYEKELSENDIKLIDSDNKLQNVNDDIIKLTSNIEVLKSDIININSLNDLTITVDELETDRLKHTQLIIKLNNDNILSNNKINEINKLIDEYTNDLIEIDTIEYNKNITEYNRLQNEINIINTKITISDGQLNKYSDLCFCDDCDDCSTNIKVLKIDDDKLNNDKLRSDRDCLTNSVELLLDKTSCNSIDAYKGIFNTNENLKSKIQQSNFDISKINSEILSNELTISKNEKSINDINDKINLINTNKSILDNNNKINILLTDLNTDLAKLKKEYGELNNSKINLISNDKVIKFKIDERNKLLSEINSFNKQFNDYSNYASAMGKNGIPLTLMKNVIELLNDEVNIILDNITNFKISFELNDSDIDAFISYDEVNKWDVSTISGMEKFITSLAIRIALINISHLPRPNFICIDEGFGVLDSSNLNELKRLFEYFKTIFNFYIIITHIEVLRDFVDNSIDIQKINGFSNVKY